MSDVERFDGDNDTERDRGDRGDRNERSDRNDERPREPRGRDRRDDSIRSLFVRGLASGTRAEDLTSAFETYGTVKDVYIPKDYYNGGIKGFAYIQYATQEEADKAFEKIEYLTINGRRLTVEWAQGDRKTPNQMRSKDAPRRRTPDRYRRDNRDNRDRSRSRDRRRRSRSRSRSPPRRRDRSRSRDRDYNRRDRDGDSRRDDRDDRRDR
ncbi:Serine/arginine-rich splicing factor 12 [Rhizoclosmatium sp. JEL0117]|nr:Serine/arginine-rich splicing factor 12 [Rhizoclosmatium sp. JEL0117]